MPRNPVLSRFNAATSNPSAPHQTTYPNAPTQGDLEQMYHQPAYGGPTYPPTAGGYGGGGGGGDGFGTTRYMTLDDVVTRTGAMLAVLFAAGAVSWSFTSATGNGSGAAGALLIVSLMGGLGLGFYMALTMKANALTSLLYAAFEGVLLGAVSRIFEARFHGIVVQALTGTVMVALGVLFVYRIGAIRVTPRFTRVAIAGLFGVFGLMIVNFIAYLFTPNGLGLRDGGPLAIIFSLVCIGVAAMMLVMDFDMIEQGIRRGAPEKFAWYASFALLVTLIWLYTEILRLLGYIRN